jgi:hypothetical protein
LLELQTKFTAASGGEHSQSTRILIQFFSKCAAISLRKCDRAFPGETLFRFTAWRSHLTVEVPYGYI